MMIKKRLALTALLLGPELFCHVAQAAEMAEPKAQLLDLDVNAIVWVLVIFIVMAVILYRTAWKNVLVGLKQREARIRKDIADADALRVKAEGTLKQFNDQLATAEQRARDILSKATAHAESLATQIRARAQQEAEEARERAVREIEVARKQAITDLYAQAADLATSIAEKILRRNLNPDDQRDLVEQSIAQFEKVGAN